MINHEWGDSKFPLVRGHEIIETIEQTGSNVASLKNGDRVGISNEYPMIRSISIKDRFKKIP